MALIIIVDDDPHVRDGLENLLASAGLASISFSGGDALLADGAWHDADCFLLDVRMNGMSGLQLQQRLLERGVSIPIIFLTAHSDGDTKARALANGALAFFAKPFDEDELLAAIDTAVARARARPD
ncbi:response regulator [Caulobacter sp. CCNWLY153]|uniref:Two-component system response regulator n=1 Tax=Caulobacter radicis TaxID=2172650 RepID=A0A2T9JM83_9CAUL|nr:response regulator [Caulobacter radicis]PVM84774.1 two-component system response regulator [Caulobacter radicis]